MKFPQIRMESQMARIGIEQTSGKQEIHQPKAEMTIEQPKADLSIHAAQGRLTIDQTEAWEEMNLMSTMRFIDKTAQEGKQQLLEGVARRAEQGTELMRIEHDGQPIIDQALINGHRQQKSLSIDFIPSPFSVKINYIPGDLHIEATANRPHIHARQNKPEHYYERGDVHIYMEQYESLTIDFENLFSVSV